MAQHQTNSRLGRLTAYDADTLAVLHNVHLGAKGDKPIGVGIGYDGNVWTANQRSANVSVYNPVTGAIGHFPAGSGSYTLRVG